MPSTTQQDVTAVIVNYGSRKDTIELAEKIEPQVKNSLVVDNSGDFSDRDSTPATMSVLDPGKNIGFGAAVNLAASRCDTRWLLILNPDVRLKRNCLKHLLDASRQLHAPLCGPRFYWDDACTLQLPPALGHPLWLLSDRQVPDKKFSDNPDVAAIAITRHERFWKEQSPFTEPVLSGACLLADLEWFRKNNMDIFDEDFFLYFEDTDLCGRLMRKGVMPVCVPDACAVHYWNQAAEPPEGKSDLMAASEKIFLEKYYPNGAPSLPRSNTNVGFHELGQFDQPPALLLPDNTDSLDIGVQKEFIVFVRTKVTKPTFTFSRAMWQRIRDGQYYFRAVDARGHPLQCWQWQKTS